MKPARPDHQKYVRTVMLFAFGLVFVNAVAAQILDKDLYKVIDARAWSAEELNALANGEVVVRPLETKAKGEIASIGVVKIRNLSPVSRDKFRESLSQKGSDTKKVSGIFSNPPVLADLDDLELEETAITKLKECTIGNCDLNLSADNITRFQREVDWTSKNARADATRILKEMLVARVRDYLAKGDRALEAYDNRRKTVELARVHGSFLARSTLVSELAPEFIEYLESFPDSNLENVSSAMRWSVIDFGLKPTIAITHSSAYTQVRGGYSQHFLASKQIYSSRYLDCSLSFTLLIQVASETGVDTYLIFVDRSRSDALEGPLGGFARRLVRKESMDRIKALLEIARLRLTHSGMTASKTDLTSDDASSDSWSEAISKAPVALTTGIVILLVLFVLWRGR